MGNFSTKATKVKATKASESNQNRLPPQKKTREDSIQGFINIAEKHQVIAVKLGIFSFKKTSGAKKMGWVPIYST